MGRSKRHFETIPLVTESSTRESVTPFGEATSEPSDISSSINETHASKKTRGKTKMNDVWRVPADQRIPISLDNLGMPVDPNAQALSSYIGVVIKSQCPLNYETWHRVPAGTKNYLKNLLRAKFAYPPQIEGWLNSKLSERFRGHKSELKKAYFDPFLSFDDNLKNCPHDEVEADQWFFLVQFWCSPKGKKLEEIGKNSRGDGSSSHTTGSMSFARFRGELKRKKGTNVTRIEVFQGSHISKDGTYIDSNVPNIVDMANAEKAKLPEMSPTDMDIAEIKILDDALGPKYDGRIRGVGPGATRRKLFGPKVSKMHTDEEFDNLHREMAANKEQFKNKIKSLEEQMKREREEQSAQMRMLIQELQSIKGHQKIDHRRSHSSRSSYGSYPDASR